MLTLTNLKARRDQEDGFTLIELMVVVLIIAILIAIAIPTFLGARSRAQDKAAQSNVRNGISAAKTVFTDGQDYADATAAALLVVEPSLAFQASNAVSTQPKEVSVLAVDSDVATAGSETIYMASKSKSGKCWAVRDVQEAAGAGTSYAEVAAGDCDADNASTLAAGAWGDSF